MYNNSQVVGAPANNCQVVCAPANNFHVVGAPANNCQVKCVIGMMKNIMVKIKSIVFQWIETSLSQRLHQSAIKIIAKL